MPHDPEQFPKTGVAAHQPELFLHTYCFPNLHINGPKLLWLKDVIDICDRHHFEDDFCHDIDATYDWYKSTQAQGAPTVACVDWVNGVLQMTSDAIRDARIELTQRCECWKLADCYPLYAEIRFKVNSITELVFWFGLIRTHSWIVHPDDYVVFLKSSGDPSIKFRTEYNAAGSQVDTGIDLAAATWIRLGFHWDGAGTIRWFVFQDGNWPQTCLATGSKTDYICQDEELTLGFGIQTDEAVLKTMYIDFVKCTQIRVIE